jgi:hypothetical protein
MGVVPLLSRNVEGSSQNTGIHGILGIFLRKTVGKIRSIFTENRWRARKIYLVAVGDFLVWELADCSSDE